MTRPTPASERPLIAPHDRAQWREWLDSNHATSGGIWLAVGKKGNPVTELDYEGAVLESLCFGWIDSTAKSLDEDRFMELFGPRKRGSVWSRSNKQRVERLVAEGLMTPAGLAVIAAAKADGSWTILDEVEDLVVPDDLAAALEAEAGAADGFAALSDGRRKLALYWIASAKRPQTRERRVAATVAAAAEGRAVRCPRRSPAPSAGTAALVYSEFKKRTGSADTTPTNSRRRGRDARRQGPREYR